jgi:hypothetical protein
MPGGTHDRHRVCQGEEARFRPRAKSRPVARMFFRPEEINAASGIRQLAVPFPDGQVYIHVDVGGVVLGNDAIAHYHTQGLPAVEARCVNLYGFPRKEPADC